jgi:hypothetical protein
MHSIEHDCLGHKNMTELVVSTPPDKQLIPAKKYERTRVVNQQFQ